LEAVLSKNPELISKMLNPQKPKSQFMTQQEINIDKQRAMIQQKEKELKQKQMQMNRVQTTTPQPQQSFENKQTGPSYMNPPVISSPNTRVQPEPEPSNQSRNKIYQGGVPEIRAPENVQEILNRIRNQNLNTNTDSIDSAGSNNDRLVSDVNLSDSKKGKKGKKQNISIPSISINA
jgi:hypothetical protein